MEGRCEAGIDSFHEAFVQFPDSPDRELLQIAIQDVHGVDFTVEKVRENLLRNHSNKNKHYRLAFRYEINKEIINVNQAHAITEYMIYLTDPNYTVIFVPL